MKLIRKSLVAIGDSFTDFHYSWANYLSTVLQKPLIKFTIPGASNKTILDNFYANWTYDKITFEDCLIIFQSTAVDREDLDITPDSYGHQVFNYWFRFINTDNNMPIPTVEIYGRKYLLSACFHNILHNYKTSSAPGHFRLAPDLFSILSFSTEDKIRFLSFQTNLLSEAFKANNNKFLFLLGLHNNAAAEEFDFSQFPVNCEIAAYEREGKKYGIDQYVLDINQYDKTTHPTIEGHQSITNNIVIPKLRELKWITK